MPRDGSSIYHVPPGTQGIPDTTVASTPYNAFLADVEQDANLPRPVVAGGTGATNKADAMTNLGGELSAQVIANYNADPFQAGSFYSAAGATGAPTANAFTGICYAAVITGVATTDLFIEARDQTTGNLWVRQKKANVWQPWVQAAGIATSSTPPASVPPNTLWWDPTRGKLFIYYQDVDSSQWVEAVAVPNLNPNQFVLVAGGTMTGPLILSGDPTVGLGAGTKQYIDAGDAATVAAATAAAVLQGYLFGLTMSTAGASATLSVGAGAATDSTGARLMKLAAAMAKTTGAWAAGNGAGGLDTGTIAANTWYHWYLIFNPTTSAVDLVFSATATPASGPTAKPAGFTLFRRLGAMKTNASSQWTGFVQTGNKFMWSAPVLDVNATNPGTAAVTRTLSTPSGIITEAIIFAVGGASSTSADHPAAIYISDLALPDVAALMAGAGNVAIYLQGGGPTVAIYAGGTCQVNTNTSSQVRSRLQLSAAGTVLQMTTLGWNDTRGRDA